MQELAVKLGYDSKDQEYLKETLEALVDFTVDLLLRFRTDNHLTTHAPP